MKQAGIMVISDGSPFLSTITKALESVGFVVCLTESWPEAREELVRRFWGLVIVKMPLPQAEDTQVLQMIKKLHPDAKLLVLSDNELLPVAAFEYDVDDYLVTSLRPADFWRRILTCLNKAQPTSVTRPSLSRPEAINKQVLNKLGLMFHDIRGSMISIDAAIQLLIRAAGRDLCPEHVELLKHAQGKTQKLLSLTEEFLKNTFKPQQYIPIEIMQDLIDPVLDELKDDLGRKRLIVDINLGPLSQSGLSLKGDKASLKSMFRNLIMNAIHHGKKNSTIVIELAHYQSKLQIRVYNEGSPIPEEYQHQLFAQFSPLTKKGNSKKKGLGLGLYLVREFLQSQGGDIHYEPHHQGSNFIVTLPSS